MESLIILVCYLIALFALWGWRLGCYTLASILVVIIASVLFVFLTKGSEYKSVIEPLATYISYYSYLILGGGAIYRCINFIEKRKNKVEA